MESVGEDFHDVVRILRCKVSVYSNADRWMQRDEYQVQKYLRCDGSVRCDDGSMEEG